MTILFPDKDQDSIRTFLLDLQNRLCNCFEQEEGKAGFVKDEWEYDDGKGGGITRIFANGCVLEKAGVNFSCVQGKSLPQAATAKRPDLANVPFLATGISVVVHPVNPFVPTAHFNVRFIHVNKEKPVWWFGGGFDMTPYYGFVEDCQHWHQMAKNACDPFGKEIYPAFKKWADQYFYLKHRKEPRGIGGIFFDDLNNWDFATCFAFMRSVSEHFIKAYQPIVSRRKNHVYGEAEKAFQLYRRGRYVEFNLLYDRGTLFGLQSQGRTESILMSLPPKVAWQYNWKPSPDSPEAKLYQDFLPVQEWI